MGPVMPLLAVHEALKKSDPSLEGVWIGTRQGPERAVVEAAGFSFFALPTARLSRSFRLEWLLLPFLFCSALVSAARIIRAQEPDVVGSAGGYTAVPVVIAARMLGVPVWVHSQDVHVTLTTRLTAPFARRVTAAWEASARVLGAKARVVGNPVRRSILMGSKPRVWERFALDREKPTVVIFGGGTGAAWLNDRTGEIAERLTRSVNVVHLTGSGKGRALPRLEHYAVREFLREDMADALAVADLVVCRAGMGTITELAALGKPAVLIPLPDSAQEENAAAVQDACVVLDQRATTSNKLLETIERLLHDPERRRALGEQMRRALRTDIADELAAMLAGMEK